MEKKNHAKWSQYATSPQINMVFRMIHADEALKMPNEFEAVARSEEGVVAAVECTRRQFYGIQYHSQCIRFSSFLLIKQLLLSGYHVVGTIRDAGNDTKVAHLWNLQGAKERLHLVKSELTEDGSFDNAIMGCDGVFHMPFPVLGQPTQGAYLCRFKGPSKYHI
ncbi:bifunctional polymyxin resistance protein, ArnA [Artemisia annua]|uniref:Bifunctional polymyxin resistance protein, ArnA n=1 Tax=Artemisia annua TaxID=35608 RepID=A0A2U1L4H7_ARTAN|nr:bifunctional polymyxin resistance protein, ArnA [Artemisia annua]